MHGVVDGGRLPYPKNSRDDLVFPRISPGSGRDLHAPGQRGRDRAKAGGLRLQCTGGRNANVRFQGKEDAFTEPFCITKKLGLLGKRRVKFSERSDRRHQDDKGSRHVCVPASREFHPCAGEKDPPRPL